MAAGKIKIYPAQPGKEVIFMLKERLDLMRTQYAYTCADGKVSITIGKNKVEKAVDDLKDAAAKISLF